MVPTGCTVVPLFYDVPRGAVQGRDVTSFPVVPSSLLQLTSGHPLDSTYGSSRTSLPGEAVADTYAVEEASAADRDRDAESFLAFVPGPYSVPDPIATSPASSRRFTIKGEGRGNIVGKDRRRESITSWSSSRPRSRSICRGKDN